MQFLRLRNGHSLSTTAATFEGFSGGRLDADLNLVTDRLRQAGRLVAASLHTMKVESKVQHLGPP